MTFPIESELVPQTPQYSDYAKQVGSLSIPVRLPTNWDGDLLEKGARSVYVHGIYSAGWLGNRDSVYVNFTSASLAGDFKAKLALAVFIRDCLSARTRLQYRLDVVIDKISG